MYVLFHTFRAKFLKIQQLLCIIPVHDSSGTIVYFIGGQTNVTGLLATEKGLGLHGATDGPPQPIQMSPALAQFREQTSNMRPAALDPALRTRGAAGAAAATNGRSNAGGGTGFFRGLFGRAASTGSGVPDGKQVIAGAEAMINGPGARGLQVSLLSTFHFLLFVIYGASRTNMRCSKIRTTRLAVLRALSRDVY